MVFLTDFDKTMNHIPTQDSHRAALAFSSPPKCVSVCVWATKQKCLEALCVRTTIELLIPNLEPRNRPVWINESDRVAIYTINFRHSPIGSNSPSRSRVV